jgi:tetratricopeptide (TPR) repeat protein
MDCGGWFTDAFCIGIRPQQQQQQQQQQQLPTTTNNNPNNQQLQHILLPSKESSNTEHALLNAPFLGSDLTLTSNNQSLTNNEIIMSKLCQRIDELQDRIQQRRSFLLKCTTTPLTSTSITITNNYNTLMDQGKESFKQANFEDAGNLFDLAFKSSQNEMEAARALVNLGNVCYTLVKYYAALHHYKKAIILFRSLNEPGYECAVLDNAMETCIKLQRFELALGFTTRKTALEVVLTNTTSQSTLEKARWILTQITLLPLTNDVYPDL